MDRRETIKWVLAAGASWPLWRLEAAQALSATTARGYGTDPDLQKTYRAGEPWPLTLTPAQRRLAGVLSDLIIPADDHSPGAAAVGIVDFIDEWVSSPYPDCQRDRGVVLGGLAWLDIEAGRRTGRDFVDLDAATQATLCDSICDVQRAPTSMREAAHFFARYRDLTSGGYYSSEIGRQDLKYIGNVPLATFDGPPLALLKSLGLA